MIKCRQDASVDYTYCFHTSLTDMLTVRPEVNSVQQDRTVQQKAVEIAIQLLTVIARHTVCNVNGGIHIKLTLYHNPHKYYTKLHIVYKSNLHRKTCR